MGASSEAGRMAASAHLRNARGGHAQFVGQFLVGRFAAQFLLQLHRQPAHLGNFVHEMNRQADGLGLVGQRAFDGLLDPPRAVGGKLAAFFRVKALDGLHQADVAFADQIQQRQADAFVIARNFHDEAQIGLDHLLARLFVALLDFGGEFNFLLRREQFHLADFAQVKLDGRVAVVAAGFAVDERRGVAFGGLVIPVRRGWRGWRRDGGLRRGNSWFSPAREFFARLSNFGRFAFFVLRRHAEANVKRGKSATARKLTSGCPARRVM